MIVTKTNLERSYEPIKFTWELGKTEVIKETRKDYRWNGTSFDVEEKEVNLKKFVPTEKKFKIAYEGNGDVKSENEKRLGSTMKTLVFFTNEKHDRIYVYFARMINNTKRGDLYHPSWDLDIDLHYEVDKQKNIFLCYDGKIREVRNFKFDHTNALAQKENDLKDTFESVFGENLSYKGEILIYKNEWRLIEFLKVRQARMSSKNEEKFQKRVNAFGEGQQMMTIPNSEQYSDRRYGTNILVLDEDPDGLYMFRTFSYIMSDGIFIETGREFEFNGKPTFSSYGDSWYKNTKPPFVRYSDFKISDKAAQKYKYKVDMIESYNFHQKNKSMYYIVDRSKMIDLLTNDLYEKIYKIVDIEHFLNVAYYSIEHVFGTTNRKGSTIYSRLGMSKEQFDAWKEEPLMFGHGSISLIRRLKNIFGKESISDMSPNLFKEIITKFRKSGFSWLNNIFEATETYGKLYQDLEYNVILKIYNVTSQENKGNEEYFTPQNSNLLKDYYNSLLALKEGDYDISGFPKLPAGSSIIRYHDLAIEILNSQKDKISAVRFEKVLVKRKSLEYSNDQYSLILPKTGSDITREGALLRHCVGGYVRNVEEGRTTIIFLRKNEDIDNPFYTIEVSNSNRIVQIHGFGNKFLGNNPETISFIVDWIKKNKLTYDKADILSDGKHYGENKHLIENVWGL